MNIKLNKNFLDAAFMVLSETNRPMHASDIIHHARTSKFLTTDGLTPSKTLNARISEDILKYKSKSRFMRTGSGLFALRKWNRLEKEVIVPRRKKALIDESVLVFEKKLLSQYNVSLGLEKTEDIHHKILASVYSENRSEAEKRYDIIQLVSVYCVRYFDRYITHRRSKRLPEGRLHGKYSCFFGGHLNENDLMPLFRISDPDQAMYLLDRELSEELIISQKPKRMDFKGLLYDPRTEVSKQHIGVVFCVDIQSDVFQIGERGFLTDAKFEQISDMNSRLDEFENWSEHLIRNELRTWN